MAEVILIERIFPKYRRDVLDELKKKIDFKLIHSTDNSGISQVTSKYSNKIKSVRFDRVGTYQFLFPFILLLRHRPKVITHDFALSILSLIPTMVFCKLIGTRVILWGHGYDRVKGFNPKTSLLDKLRIVLMKNADAVLLYGQEAKETLKVYISLEKLFVAQNCLNTISLGVIRDQLETEGKEQVKKRIGFISAYNLIFIGRMIESKKPQLLISALQILKSKFNDSINLHFIGDGEYLTKLKGFASASEVDEMLTFHGSIHDDRRTGEMLFSSDLMIMPGYVGLSLNHAFNFDCPVITFAQKDDGPFHSPEIEYLIDGETGYLLTLHTAEAIASAVEKFIDDEKSQITMKSNIRHIINNVCSVNNFVEGFSDAIQNSMN